MDPFMSNVLLKCFFKFVLFMCLLFVFFFVLICGLLKCVVSLMSVLLDFLFYFISVFFGALQAFIFTVLTSIYISGATSEE